MCESQVKYVDICVYIYGLCERRGGVDSDIKPGKLYNSIFFHFKIVICCRHKSRLTSYFFSLQSLLSFFLRNLRGKKAFSIVIIFSEETERKKKRRRGPLQSIISLHISTSYVCYDTKVYIPPPPCHHRKKNYSCHKKLSDIRIFFLGYR